MKIAIDVYGGDNAPYAILDGCALALERDKGLELLLFGDETVILEYVRKNALKNVDVRHAPGVISMHDKPTEAIKKKKDSSLVMALNAVACGEAACIVTAGSTGAALTGATLLVRRIKGVKRPALAPFMPARQGCVLLLDCGANTDCKPSYLEQFAVMGSAYYSLMRGVENPRVGLLNNGTEESKGNELTKAAYQLLKSAPINFSGNCEARDALSGEFEVVVSDGFSGNVLLKNTEGIAALLNGMLKDELMGSIRTKIGAAIAKPAFRNFKKRMDYTEYGGALLLGINGGVIKAHGSSNAKAFAAAIGQAQAYASADVTGAITKAIETFLPGSSEE